MSVAWGFAVALGFRLVTVESYRRPMWRRWLSGRFCDPTDVLGYREDHP